MSNELPKPGSEDALEIIANSFDCDPTEADLIEAGDREGLYLHQAAEYGPHYAEVFLELTLKPDSPYKEFFNELSNADTDD